ncbi:MAG: hypothetical protein GF353_09760 [Candidatus Lokiarchaeota archaeon]|nr:hypothetical protein [Candidatus Lokiarchaeota archaeon]
MDKSFQDISSGKMELFSSFFSALKSFISEMVLEGSKELRNIGMGDYTVLITSISEIKADLVIIGDKDDQKEINKIIPKVVKLFLKNKEVFLEWDGKRADFKVFDESLTEIIQSNKKLIGKASLIEKPETVLKSIWAHKLDLSDEEKQKLSKELETLKIELDQTENVARKLEILDRLLNLSENLKAEQEFINFQNKKKQLKDQLRDVKLKLRYYLERVKESVSEAVNSLGNKPINEGSYKEVYLNLYSFSNKLKLISLDDTWEKYREMANMLINKDDFSRDELSDAIQFVFKMKTDVNEYINI